MAFLPLELLDTSITLQCCLAMEGWCLGQEWPKANLGKCHISVSSLLGAIFIYDMGTGNL